MWENWDNDQEKSIEDMHVAALSASLRNQRDYTRKASRTHIIQHLVDTLRTMTSN